MTWLCISPVILLLLLSFSLFLGCYVATVAPLLNSTVDGLDAQLDILKEFYYATGGPKWWDSSGWIFSRPSSLCSHEWYGVECDATGKYLVKLKLDFNNLRGTIPSSFFNLTTLSSLSMNVNLLSGTISTLIGQLSSLSYLDFAMNNFENVVPTQLCLLSSLTDLDLSSNYLTSTIPSQISNLHLTSLNLAINSFSGRIDWISGLPSLSFLTLNKNLFTGTIIPGITQLINLKTLDLGFNRLRGTFPRQMFCSTTKLTLLSLPQNKFSGTLSCLEELSNLYYLDISFNNFQFSSFPSSILSLSKLKIASLNRSGFRGTIPPGISGLKSLIQLLIGGNFLTGTIPSELWAMSNLKIFNCSSNKLVGTIPSSIGLLTLLAGLSLANNQFFGRLPKEIVNCTKLSYVELTNNRFSGNLASFHLGLPLIEILNLGWNAFTGELPQSFLSRTPKLQFLDLSFNQIKGDFSPCLNVKGSLKLESIDVISNSLVGKIGDLGCLSNLKSFRLSENMFNGFDTPSQLSGLKNIFEITAASNKFTELPTQLFDLTTLVSLDFDTNNIGGTIESRIQNLVKLRMLQLSSNEIVGSIPTELCSLPLQNIGLGSNRLTGVLPQCLNSMQSLQNFSCPLNEITGHFDLFSAKNLTLIDISSNKFSGSLSDLIFDLRKLLVFAAASNCFTGTLPKTLCNAAGLSVLVLDGVGSGSKCPISGGNSITSQFPGIRGRASGMHGRIPECIFTSFPRIELLHFSGLNLKGSIPADFNKWPPKLGNLAFSHNGVSGSFSLGLQKGASQLKLLDGSFNRIDGFLSDLIVSNTTVLDLRVNRFSGSLSKSIVYALPGHISVLDGNLIDCSELDGRKDLSTQLPANDPYYKDLKCGSQVFNGYMILYSILSVVLILILLIWSLSVKPEIAPRAVRTILVKVSQQIKLSYSDFRSILLGQDDAIKLNIQDPSKRLLLQTLFTTLSRARRFAFCSSALLFVVVIPTYGGLSYKFSTHAESYAWTVAASYKSGVIAAAVLLILWTSLLLVSLYYLSKWFSDFGPLEPKTNDRSSRVSSSGVVTVVAPWVHRILSLVRQLLVFVLDVVCVLTPNVLYVKVVSNSSSDIQTIASVFLSLYKQFWNSVVLSAILHSPRLYFWLPKDQQQRQVLKSSFVYQVALNAFNSILAPSLALVFADSNCFKFALQPAPLVESTYPSTGSCTVNQKVYFDRYNTQSLVTTLNCKEHQITMTFAPSFSYQYQCSSALLSVYSPVFLLMAIFSWTVQPVYRVFIRKYVLEAFKSTSTLHWTLKLLRKILIKTIPRLTHTASERLEFQKKRYLVIDCHAIFLNLLQDLLLLLSFGMATPLLGIVMATSLFMRSLQWHWMCISFLQNPLEHGTGFDDFFTDLEKFFVQHSRLRHPMYKTRWFIILFSSWFLSYFLLDTAGDAVGWKEALWAPLLLFSIPALLSALSRIKLWRHRGALTDSVKVELELASPLHSQSQSQSQSLEKAERADAEVSREGDGDGDGEEIERNDSIVLDQVAEPLDIPALPSHY